MTTEAPIDLKNFDKTVPTGKSFYQHVNGGWLAANEIPADQQRWGSFMVLREKSRNDVQALFESLKDLPLGESLLAEMYASGMNFDQTDGAGLAPAQDLIDQVDAITNLSELSKLQGKLSSELIETGCFFACDVINDFKNSKLKVCGIFQNGLGLPDRDYYLDSTKEEYCQKYLKHIENIFVLAGESADQGKRNAEIIFAIEKEIAGFSISKVEMRNMEKIYNPLTFDELKGIAPGLGFEEYFAAMDIQKDFQLFVHNIEYYKQASLLMQKTKIEDLKLYLKFHVIGHISPFLSLDFVKEHFEFSKKGLSGQKEMEPRWKDVVETLNTYLGDLVGQLYVEKHFPDSSKKACKEMVQYIIDEFGTRIKSLDWMTDETKKMALKKLSTFRVKIGFPDQWRDYSSLKGNITRDKVYFSNVRLAAKKEFQRRWSELMKAPNPWEWEMTPNTVNAYYHPMNNEIVFPAAILQPPFFYGPTTEHPNGQPAMNFGGIGAVISHEITHGFDDQGGKFDSEGNMVDWWTEADTKEFDRRREKIVDQFDKFKISTGHSVNGKLTQGENIADLGGVSVSYAAFLRYMKDHPSTLVKNHDFSQEQQFFISFCQIWRSLSRDELAIKLISTDPHSPGEFRADGTLANFAPFHEAFGIKKGDPMYADEEARVEIW